MSRTFTAYVIDPAARTITAVTKEWTLDDIYEAINTSHFEAVYSRRDTLPDLFMDEEAIQNQPEAFFWYDGFPFHPLRGNAVVMDVDEEGMETSPKMPLSQFKQHVRFGQVGRIAGQLYFMETDVDPGKAFIKKIEH